MRKAIILFITGLLINLSAAAQWNTDTNVNNLVTPAGQTNYGCTIKTNKNGTSYAFMEMPIKGVVVMKLQIIDKDGVKLFPDEGIVVSNEPTLSYTVIGERVFIDDEGNAIIIVNDQRTGGFSYTLYKYDEKGNKIWGGVQLNKGESLIHAAGLKICQTTDGGYVVAYLCNDKSNNMEDTFVQYEKVDRDGNFVWEPFRIGAGENEETCSYPYLVEAGSNQCILVYAKGSNQNLMARLLDIDGESAWEDDVVVYNGGNWGTIPLHVLMNVYKGPNNGVIVSWHDGRNNVNYQNCISYITNDGTYGFSTGTEGTLVSNDDNYSRKFPEVFYDDDEKAIYCIFYQFNQAYQSFNGLFMQKISFDGELLWGANGKAIIDIQNENHYAYSHIRNINKDKFAVFYQEKEGDFAYGHVNSYVQIYDKEGNALSGAFNFSTTEYEKSSLEVSQLINDKYFLAYWDEERLDPSYEEGDDIISATYMQYIDYESIITGIDEVNVDSHDGIVSKQYFSVSGKKLSTPVKGVNIIKTTQPDGSVDVNKVIM